MFDLLNEQELTEYNEWLDSTPMTQEQEDALWFAAMEIDEPTEDQFNETMEAVR